MFHTVSRREAIFCLTGIFIGTMTGYYIGMNWQPVPRHVHRIKAITCYHYRGVEVHCKIYLIIFC